MVKNISRHVSDLFFTYDLSYYFNEDIPYEDREKFINDKADDMLSILEQMGVVDDTVTSKDVVDDFLERV